MWKPFTVLRHWLRAHPSKQTSSRRARPQLEVLEDRRLLAGDWTEPSDTRDEAVYLGRGGSLTWLGLSIHSSTDVDWIKFRTDATGGVGHNVGIDFNHANGDLDIRLHDSNGNFLDSSAGVTNNERISLAGWPAGTYYLEVYGYGGATNDYSFLLNGPGLPAGSGDFLESNDNQATAFDVPTIASATDPGFTLSGLDIHTSTDQDWYKVELLDTGSANHYLHIEFAHALGDLDMILRDANGTQVGVSEGATNEEHISLNGRPAGTYYLQVYGFKGAVNSYSFRGFGPLAPSGDRFEPNNAQAAAANLGSITSPQRFENLSITANDADWYRFQLVGSATSAHAATIEFLHSAGDLDLELRDGNGNLLASSTGVSDSETISLAGLPAGTYFLHVYGFLGTANPSYRLSLSGPAAGIAADSREQNDTAATANDLGTLQGQQSITGLTIDQANDDDWYRFTLSSPGAAGNSVRIDFTHAAGDVDLQLFSSTNTSDPLRSSTGTIDQEEISLDGLAAGTYYARVYGFNGATCPDYDLTIKAPQAPTGDAFEPNDTRATAKNLGQLRGPFSQGNLSIHTTTDQDWFRFDTVGAGANGHYARIEFQHSQGDLDFVLLDANGAVLTSSAGVENAETISLNGRPAGTYYLQVYGYNGSRNPNYTLTIEAPTGGGLAADNLEANNTFAAATLLRTGNGTTLTASQSVANLTIHNSTDVDLFKFTTVGPGTAAHSVRIQTLHANGDLDLQLYDSNQQLLRSSTGAHDSESIALDGLPAGTYFARVFGAAGATNTYSVTVDPPPPPAQGPAQDAWTIMIYMTASDLDTFAFRDVNEMEIAASRLPGSVNLAVYWDQSAGGRTFATGNGQQPAWGTAGRAIITGDTNSNQVATTFELLGEQNTGNPATLTGFIQWAVQQAPAQRTALILWDHGAGLSGSNFDNLDRVASDNLTIPEIVSALGSSGRHLDLTAQDSCLMAMAEVGYSLRSLADVFVASEEVIPGNGYDYTTAFNALMQNPEQVTAEGLGTSLVQSYQAQYVGQGNEDTLSAVRTSQYANLATALQTFTTATATATAADLAALGNARDGAIGYTEATFRDLGTFMRRVLNGSAATAIKNAAQGVLNVLTNLIVTKTNDQRSSSGQAIYLPAVGGSLRGDYGTAFSGFDAATGWRSFLQRLVSGTVGRVAFTPDWAEDNGDFATARALNTLNGPGNAFPNLSLHDGSDQDWFRFRIAAAGVAGNSVTVTPTNLSDSLALTLFDAAGTQLSQDTGAGSRTISLQGRAAGEYVIRVTTVSNQLVPQYALSVNAPVAGNTDLAVDNSTRDKAFELGTILQDSVFTGFQAAASGTDWFHFSTARVPIPAPATLRVRVAGANAVTAQLLNEQNQVVVSATGTGDLTLPYEQRGEGESYYVRILGNGTAAVSHSLAFTVSNTNLPFVPQPPVVIDVGGTTVVVTVQSARGDVTGRVSVVQVKKVRKGNRFRVTLRVTNISAELLTAPLALLFSGLNKNTRLLGAGRKNGVPFISLPGGNLAAGQEVTLEVTFTVKSGGLRFGNGVQAGDG